MTWQAATSGAGQVQRAACAAQDARAALDASDDLTRLACDLDDAGVLEHVARRFAAARFGTFVGSVLLCVNPMREAHEPLEACGSTRAAAHPHPFASAEGAFQRLQRERRSQCIVISGESGAGKSETFKRVLQHLVGRSEASARGVEKRLLAASPILESLGNAATTSNANSSRFGKFVRLHYARSIGEAGTGLLQSPALFARASVETYLLERSRVTDREASAFHIFYQLFQFTDPAARALLGLDVAHIPPLAHTEGRDVALDRQRLSELRAALGAFGVDDLDVFSVVAAIVHLMSVRFEQEGDGESATHTANNKSNNINSTNSSNVAVNISARLTGLEDAARLLCVSSLSLKRALTERQIRLRGEIITSRLGPEVAAQARDALAKALYQLLFNWAARCINHGLGSDSGLAGADAGMAGTVAGAGVGAGAGAGAGAAAGGDTSGLFVGILDIFGFERFERNGLEQLLINFANEALQAMFHSHILEAEQLLYRAEGLDLSARKGTGASDHDRDIEVASACLSLLARRAITPCRASSVAAGGGLLAAIDGIALGPEPSDRKLLAHLNRTFKGHACFPVPHPLHRETTFVVEHYAGPVSYHIGTFVDKNTDRVPPEAERLFAESSSAIVRSFRNKGGPPTAKSALLSSPHGTHPLSPSPSQHVQQQITVAGAFEQQIHSLLGVMGSTHCAFIRCIKPNARLDRGAGFDSAIVQAQLRCLAVPQTVRLLRHALPCRVPYTSLFAMLSVALPAAWAGSLLSPRGGARGRRAQAAAVLQHVGKLNSSEYMFGRTMVFFTSGAMPRLEEGLRALDPESAVENELAQVVSGALVLEAARTLLLHAAIVRRASKRRDNRTAATKIQSWVRRLCATRLASCRRRENAAQIAALQLERTRCAAHKISREKAASEAATRLQAAWRCCSHRSRYVAVRHAVRCLQAAWRSRGEVFLYSDFEEDDGDFEGEEVKAGERHRKLRRRRSSTASGKSARSARSSASGKSLMRPLGSRGASLGSLVHLLSDVDDDAEVNAEDVAQRLSSASDCKDESDQVSILAEPTSADKPTLAADMESLDDDLEHAAARGIDHDAESGEDYDGDEEVLTDLDGALPHQRLARRTALQPKRQCSTTESERETREQDQGQYEQQAEEEEQQQQQQQRQQQQQNRGSSLLPHIGLGIFSRQAPEPARRRGAVPEELTNVLVKPSRGGSSHEGPAGAGSRTGPNTAQNASAARNAPARFECADSLPSRRDIAYIVEEYMTAAPRSKAGTHTAHSDKAAGTGGGRERRSWASRLIGLPGSLLRAALPDWEERAVLKRLRNSTRDRDFHKLIKALVRARELSLRGPDVEAAEELIARVRVAHAQQLLRDALRSRDIDELEEALASSATLAGSASGGGGDSTTRLRRLALDLCADLKDKRRCSLERKLSPGKTIAHRRGPRPAGAPPPPPAQRVAAPTC